MTTGELHCTSQCFPFSEFRDKKHNNNENGCYLKTVVAVKSSYRQDVFLIGIRVEFQAVDESRVTAV